MKLKSALVGLAAIGGIVLTSGTALAMPNGLAATASQVSKHGPDIDQVRYVCDAWGRCWWRPNYYGAYGYYYAGPRYYGRPWRYGGWHVGWHRGWHRW
ncbi:MAG: hypothetical protein ABIL01_26505 [Pseudomonadota bacterium]